MSRNEHEEGEIQVRDDQNDNQDTDYEHFEVEDDGKSRLSLPEDMSKDFKKKCSTFVPDKFLNEKILDKYPLPSTSSIKAPRLDDYVPEILADSGSSFGKYHDVNLNQILGFISTVIGPVSKIWLDLDNIRAGRATGDNQDPTEWLKIVENAITLLGRAFTTMTYHRCMNVVYNLTDVKKAKRLLCLLDLPRPQHRNY